MKSGTILIAVILSQILTTSSGNCPPYVAPTRSYSSFVGLILGFCFADYANDLLQFGPTWPGWSQVIFIFFFWLVSFQSHMIICMVGTCQAHTLYWRLNRRITHAHLLGKIAITGCSPIHAHLRPFGRFGRFGATLVSLIKKA